MPVDPAVLEILQERCERVLNMGHHGFGAEQAKRCRLSAIEVDGITLGEDGDTVSAELGAELEQEESGKWGDADAGDAQIPARGASATTVVDMEVDESCCNISGELRCLDLGGETG
jgi:hypothetical protein